MFSVLLPVEDKLHELEDHVWLVMPTTLVPTTLVPRTMPGTKQILNNLNELFAPHITVASHFFEGDILQGYLQWYSCCFIVYIEIPSQSPLWKLIDWIVALCIPSLQLVYQKKKKKNCLFLKLLQKWAQIICCCPSHLYFVSFWQSYFCFKKCLEMTNISKSTFIFVLSKPVVFYNSPVRLKKDIYVVINEVS